MDKGEQRWSGDIFKKNNTKNGRERENETKICVRIQVENMNNEQLNKFKLIGTH